MSAERGLLCLPFNFFHPFVPLFHTVSYLLSVSVAPPCGTHQGQPLPLPPSPPAEVHHMTAWWCSQQGG